jgi:hypothetical protein
MTESFQTGAPEPGTAVHAPVPVMSPEQAADWRAILNEALVRRGLPPLEDGAR